MDKQTDFDTFAKNYKPLCFSFIGIRCSEHMPQDTVFGWLNSVRMHLKAQLGLPLQYFDLRYTLTTESKKRADMAFITHFIKEHSGNVRNASLFEQLHYLQTKLRYLPELRYIHSVVYSPETPNHPEQPKVDLHLLRWGYLLDVSPSFIDLIHGTNRENAIDTLENLY